MAGNEMVISITINPVLPNLQNTGNLSYSAGTTIEPYLFNNTGSGQLSEGTGCQVTSGTLPDGLTVERASNYSTCAISGTPTTVAAAVEITVTATNAAGLDASPATASITINPADFSILREMEGVVDPNVLTVRTSMSGDYSDAVETTESMASVKTTWQLDANSGELTVTITDSSHRALLLFKLDPSRDQSAFDQGELVFEINTADLNGYDDLAVGIECIACTGAEPVPLNLTATTEWITKRIQITDLVTTSTDLQQVSASLVVHPQGSDLDRTLTYKLRNVRWSPTQTTP